jgi:hypothetical protein
MLIAKKYFPFQGLSREKAGLARVSIAKKNHSSLLPPGINAAACLRPELRPRGSGLILHFDKTNVCVERGFLLKFCVT